MKRSAFISLVIILTTVIYPTLATAGPESTNYELVEYGFGSGGTASSSSTNYSMNALMGEQTASQSSTNYSVESGLNFTQQANVPPAPTFTNPSNNYDRLKIVINEGGNPSDTTYAIAISTDNFATTQYVQDDGTIGNTLSSEDWQTYTDWGGATGTWITGLSQSTTYTVKVKAEQGTYTETGWGPTTSADTTDPSLTFSVSSDSITFNNLNAGNSWTDSTQSTTVTTSTNAYNGYVVYGSVTQPLTFNATTIANYASPNSAPTTWSGTGFGYTTNDNDLTGGTADRFDNATKYAGFGTTAPGDPVADHAGPVVTPIVDEEFIISYRVTVANTQTAGPYTSTILYIVVPEY